MSKHTPGSLTQERLREMRERTLDMTEALERLANEASGFLSMADRSTHGVTNMNVLRLRIDEARAAIKKARGE